MLALPSFDATAVRTKLGICDRPTAAQRCAAGLSALGIPEAHSLIIRRCHDRLTVRAELDAIDCFYTQNPQELSPAAFCDSLYL